MKLASDMNTGCRRVARARKARTLDVGWRSVRRLVEPVAHVAGASRRAGGSKLVCVTPCLPYRQHQRINCRTSSLPPPAREGGGVSADDISVCMLSPVYGRLPRPWRYAHGARSAVRSASPRRRLFAGNGQVPHATASNTMPFSLILRLSPRSVASQGFRAGRIFGNSARCLVLPARCAVLSAKLLSCGVIQ